MGNRAVVIFAQDVSAYRPTNGKLRRAHTDYSAGVYLHWNGGPESVYAFLDYMEETSCRFDTEYGPARLAQIIGNFMGGTLSLGILPTKGKWDGEVAAAVDPGDNGVFLVRRSSPDRYRVTRFLDGAMLEPSEVASEERRARQDAYWTSDTPILQNIREANNSYFKGTGNTD